MRTLTSKNKVTLPAVFSSVEEAVKLLKLDRRHKWEEFNGELVYPHRYTTPCSGCSCDCSDGFGCNHGNNGCHECGYTGKSINAVPVPAFMPDGSIVRVKQTTDTYNFIKLTYKWKKEK